MLGGRTNHWGRISLRFGPHDFQRRSARRPGRRLADHLRRPQALLRRGRPAGRHLRLDRGAAQRARRHLPAAAAAALLRAADQAGGRRARASPASRRGSRSSPGRTTAARPATTAASAAAAARSTRTSRRRRCCCRRRWRPGRLTLVTERDGARGDDATTRAAPTGVAYIDKATGREHHVRARVVVLAASACESARLLLNSKSSRFPQGLANSSGAVGKYLTDTTGTGVAGFIPRMMDGVPHNEDGVGGAHLYMPWWLDNRTLDFPRGYHIEIGGGRRMPGAGFMAASIATPASAPMAGRSRRRLRQGAQGRLPPLLRRHGRVLRPRRDDPQRGQLLRDRSRRWWTSGASRCCAST